MTRKIFLLFLIFSALGQFSCNDSGSPTGKISSVGNDVALQEKAIPVGKSAPVASEPNPGGAFEVSERKIIRNANFSFEIKNYDSWWANLQKLVSANGGYIVNSTTENVDNNVRRGNVEIRVPEEKFSSLLENVRKSASKVERENQTGQDVTEEFVDLEARLVNKRKAEQRMQEILLKASKVQDLIEVENSLTQIREEIERMEGRKKFLENQVSFSTITIDWHEPFPLGASYGGEKSFWDKIGEGFRAGLDGFGSVLAGLIAFVIGGIPVFIFIGAVVWLFVKFIRKRKKSKPAEESLGVGQTRGE